jgi:hypothetical protein
VCALLRVWSTRYYFPPCTTPTGRLGGYLTLSLSQKKKEKRKGSQDILKASCHASDSTLIFLIIICFFNYYYFFRARRTAPHRTAPHGGLTGLILGGRGCFSFFGSDQGPINSTSETKGKKKVSYFFQIHSQQPEKHGAMNIPWNYLPLLCMMMAGLAPEKDCRKTPLGAFPVDQFVIRTSGSGAKQAPALVQPA